MDARCDSAIAIEKTRFVSHVFVLSHSQGWILQRQASGRSEGDLIADQLWQWPKLVSVCVSIISTVYINDS